MNKFVNCPTPQLRTLILEYEQELDRLNKANNAETILRRTELRLRILELRVEWLERQ